MKKFIGKFLFVVFCIVFIPILLVNFTIMIKSFMNPNEVPGIFGFKPMIVVTGSMEDTIMTGDLVFAKAYDPNNLKVDDIISYRDSNNTIITHRIVKIMNDGGKKFVTKGDNNNAEDSEYVLPGQVEGLYVGRVAKLGGFLNFIQTPIGIAISLLSITVVCLLVVIITNKIWYEESDEEKQMKKEFEEFKKSKIGKNN